MPDERMDPAETTPISENFSEKPKRGRPRVLTVEGEREYDRFGLFDSTNTRRGRVNVGYLQHALDVLMGDDPALTAYAWLIGPSARPAFRRTLLSELGRLRNEDLILAAAAELCQHKPATVLGVAYLRSLRKARRPASEESLSDRICTVLDRYRVEHPDVTPEFMIEALSRALAGVRFLQRQQSPEPNGEEG